MALGNEDKLLWWGYLHSNGNIIVKRYWDDYGDIKAALESDLVDQVFSPFEAESQEEAVKIIDRKMNNV